MKERPRVAVIGGGVAGLSCAERLSKAFDVTVYDTGRLRPGGRCSSRHTHDVPKDGNRGGILSTTKYDHAAQILSLPTAVTSGEKQNQPDFTEFTRQVREWERTGVLKRFPENSVYTLRSHKKIEPAKGELFYGAHGMSSIPEAIVKSRDFELHQDVWVSPSNGVKYNPQHKKWKVQTNGRVLGMYDSLIIAHNGKCADRLMSKTPAKELHNLLRVNFSPTVPAHGGKRMTLNSIYSLTLALPAGNNVLSKSLPSTFRAGFVTHHPSLRFLTCQTRKYEKSEKDDDDVEVWTILSSGQFAKKYKAPQEFLPDDIVDTVSTLLLKALEEALVGKTKDDDKKMQWNVLDQRLQLWGAALPLNVWGSKDGHPAGFVYDAAHNAGACGDWLVEASIAGAWTSGRLLADHMISNESLSHGINDGGAFYKSESAAKVGIGAIST